MPIKIQFTAEEFEAMRARYAAGESLASLSRSMGISDMTVRKHLAEAGIEIRAKNLAPVVDPSKLRVYVEPPFTVNPHAHVWLPDLGPCCVCDLERGCA